MTAWVEICGGEPVPAVRLRRRAILLDLNHAYLREHAAERTTGVQVELGLGALG